MPVKIEKNSVVLFQGDSITDCGRSREVDSQLGSGYANMTAALFSAAHPELNVTFLNRGISGNRAKDLKERWVADCLELKPDWLSVFIGINDCWRRYDRNDPTSPEEFEASYRFILEAVKSELKNTKIILLEPFVLPVPEDRKAWREDLDPKIQVTRELAREFETYFIPLDGIFAQASVLKPSAFWAADGVHPTQAGHALIAKHWLSVVEK